MVNQRNQEAVKQSMINAIVADLRNTVRQYATAFAAIPEDVFSKKITAEKWSNKEVVGHLIDSAQSNLRRFIVAQYESTPPNIVYDQVFWVQANNYQSMTQEDIVLLWKLLNERIAVVLTKMPEANHSKIVNTGKVSEELHPLLWLARDYVRHMQHHINQVIPNSFDIVYH